MYCESNKKYVTELDVFFDGISVLGSSKQDNNSMETFMFSRIDQKSNMIGSSLYVKNVTIEKPGSYDVSFKLYEDIDGELSDVLDEKTCSFISATPMRD